MAIVKKNVFINFPFDDRYERLYVALITGLVGLGYWPRSTLEVDTQHDRLRRIFNRLRSCDFSIHDLSRVQLCCNKPGSPKFKIPRSPRFNMPFEAGLAIALYLSGSRKKWFILEEDLHRIQWTTSDLKGYDAFAHDGTVEGMLVALLDMFPFKRNQPGPDQLLKFYRDLRKVSKGVKRLHRNNFFHRAAFQLLRESADQIAKDRGLIPESSTAKI